MTVHDVRDADLNSENPAVTSADDFVDYFGFGAEEVYTLPDGRQTIIFKKMNEGERYKYQKKTSRDIKFNRATNDAAIKADPAEERHELIMSSVTGWTLLRRGANGPEPVPFSTGSSSSALAQFLQKADPRIVDELELAIRQANPWMQADMTVEEIDKEITRLEELKREVQEREAKKSSSSAR